MTTWLFTINPHAPQAYEYGWNVDEPETLLAATDKTWDTHNFFRAMKAGDELAVFMKNTRAATGDGVYILGLVTHVDEAEREFTWRPDRPRTRKLVDAPIPYEVVLHFFGRGWGGSLRRLKPGLEREWARLVGKPR